MSKNIIAMNSQGFFEADINDFLELHEPLAFVVTEHKQRDPYNLNLLKKYELANCILSQQQGVAVFVKNRFHYRPRPDISCLSEPGKFELACVELLAKNILVIGHYRSPSSSKCEYYYWLNRLLHVIKRVDCKKVVIAGDFNIDIQKNNTIKELLSQYDMNYRVRAKTHTGGHCLDNFVTDFQPTQTRVITLKRELGAKYLSDHFPIELIF